MDQEQGFRERLRMAMDGSGKDYQDIAREAGVSRPGTGSAWLKESVPGGRALMRLPEILGVSGHWLLTGEGPMRPEGGDVEAAAFREVAAIVDRVRATAPAATVSDAVEEALDGQGGGSADAAAPPQSRRA